MARTIGSATTWTAGSRADTTGFLGAFTTFSAFSLLTAQFLETGEYGYAFANSFGSLTAGVAGAWLGLIAGRALV
jgi:Integral membrane protein possibly involved in chromosome condensation